jgi:hypothetical protein
MATARVTELKALSVQVMEKNEVGAPDSWVIPVANMDTDPFDVDILQNQMMVGYYDTLPSRGGSRKVGGSFDTHLYGGALSIGTKVSVAGYTLSGAGSICSYVPLANLFRSSGFTISVGTGKSFALLLSDNANKDYLATTFSYWQGDLYSSMTNVVTNVGIDIKGGEYINLTWEFAGNYVSSPSHNATYPSYTFGNTELAGLNGTFKLSFAASSYGTTITSDVLELSMKPNNKITMNKDLTEKWGYSDPIIVAPRVSDITFKVRAPYSIGKTGTDFWKMFQENSDPQGEPVLGLITYKLDGTKKWNEWMFYIYFKMSDVLKTTDVDGVMYYECKGQILPFKGLGASPLKITLSQ